MKKRKIKRNVGFFLDSEALPFASTILRFLPLFLEVLGKGPAGARPCWGFLWGAGSAREPLASGVGHRGCAVPLPPPTPQGGYFLCARLFPRLNKFVGGNPVVFPLSHAVLGWDSVISPSPPVSAVGRAVAGAVLWHLCEGVGQSPNCSALAERPWAATAGGVGGVPQCRVGHQFCCHLCLTQLCLVLAAQPVPSSLSPRCFLTPHLGFPSPGVPVLPLSSALCGSGSCVKPNPALC